MTYLLDNIYIYIMYFQYESDLFYENVTHLVRLQMNFVHIFYLLSWFWQNILLFVSFGFRYMNYCVILFVGITESNIICYCLILLALIFAFLHLFGLNRDIKILFVFVWSPKSPLLSMPGSNYLLNSILHVIFL